MRRRHAIARAATVAASLVLLAGCAVEAVGPDRTEVRIDDEPWVVLIAGPDGMRGRSGFDGADGMLFDQGRDVPPGAVLFVMDRVDVPLDIAWFDDDGSLVGVDAMAVCEAEPCPRYAAPGPFRWAIEAEPGAFDHLTGDERLSPGTGQDEPG